MGQDRVPGSPGEGEPQTLGGFLGFRFQKSVNRGGVPPYNFGHPLGCFAGRRRQADDQVPFLKLLDHALQGESLAGPGSPGENEYLFPQGLDQGGLLVLGQAFQVYDNRLEYFLVEQHFDYPGHVLLVLGQFFQGYHFPVQDHPRGFQGNPVRWYADQGLQLFLVLLQGEPDMAPALCRLFEDMDGSSHAPGRTLRVYPGGDGHTVSSRESYTLHFLEDVGILADLGPPHPTYIFR